MKFNNFTLQIVLRTTLIFVSAFVVSYLILQKIFWPLPVLVLIVFYLLYKFVKFQNKVKHDFEQFTESVHYRDFSRFFEEKNAPSNVQTFRKGFNQINSTFKDITKEKETQFLHLKSILEIVDTGILSYELETGDVLWMNESLKNMLQIPYLKSIHSLEKRNIELTASIKELKPQQKLVYTINKGEDIEKILLSATLFKNEGKSYKLIAFQNINQALDEGESEAWQKLLRVLTHEIMNSVAPITSLAETLHTSITETRDNQENYKETLADLDTGISTIKKRSESLLKFTESYRSLSKITKVNASRVQVSELFDHIENLLEPKIKKLNIELEVVIKNPLLVINADSVLIEQVLINLILNAIDAVKNTPAPKITLQAEEFNEKTIIKVIDNGAGIEPEILNKIFIPFFSTKKTGSGIGLSLCKQIMMLHKGSITVNSTLARGTEFSLEL